MRRSIATGICLSRRSTPVRRSPALLSASRACRTRAAKELGISGNSAYRCVHPPNATRWDDVRSLFAALVVLGLLLPAAGAARLASKSWATGKIARVSSVTIAVRGRVSLSFQTESGLASKSTLDGIRLLTCDVARPSTYAATAYATTSPSSAATVCCRTSHALASSCRGR